MGKSKQKISNWKLYNLALVKRGSLTLWMDEQAIKHWHCQTHHGRRGRGFHYSDRAIDTAPTVDQRPVVLRPIGDGVKRFTHDAVLRGMVVLRSLGFQLVPFKLHRFRKQRPFRPVESITRSLMRPLGGCR